VTLIAGFKCEGGVVLCADTLEEAIPVKYSVDKLIVYEKEWCRVGFAGSGDQGDLIDTVVERIRERLDEDKPDSLALVKASIRAALVDVYSNDIAAFPQPPPPADPIDTQVLLLIAVRAKNDSEASLLLGNCSVLHEAEPYELRGIGEVVRFVAQRLYRETLSLMETRLLCVHLLSLSKKNLTGVGGESHIVVLTNDGWIYKESIKETELIETGLEHFDRVFGDLFLAFADTGLSEDEFFPRLQKFVNLTKRLRKELCDRFAKQHLSWAINDPSYVGDPYRKLPDGTHELIGPMSVDYHFTDKPHGASGWASAESPEPEKEKGDESS
jgi:hypothetical protein